MSGSWALAEELFARGDPGFVDELRQFHHAERLGSFAPRWFADPRPCARQALLDYLSRPFNRYRHEPLVKRFFKLAESAGDDEVMGAFLVAFDRTLRRQKRTRARHKSGNFRSQAEAEAAIREWTAQGYVNSTVNTWSGRTYASAWKTEEAVVVPGNTVMPRPAERDLKKNQTLTEWQQQRYEKRFLLFSLPTRRYLRRRAWRYFRLLGKKDPARYVRAAVGLLPRYTDADADSDIHVLDNWGLTHALFHHSPTLESPASGWRFAPGKSLADLAPAPAFEAAWAADPGAVLAVLLAANARAVRQWAIWMIRRHHAAWLAARPVVELLKLADHSDPDVSALGFDLLDKAPDLAGVPVDEWLARLDGDDLGKLQKLSELLVRRLDPARVTVADAARLAAHRSRPVAALGYVILKQKPLTTADVPLLLALTQADCDTVRGPLTTWLREALTAFGPPRTEWILEFLDSKHADVRRAGWNWLDEARPLDDPKVWQKLVESPYDDVRGPLVAELADRVAAAADPDAVRLLWATVLLHVARGGRNKPGVVKRIVARLGEHPDEADQLVPLLAVAVRSLRGPEFRAGLAGVVTLAESRPDLLPTIREKFPELEW